VTGIVPGDGMSCGGNTDGAAGNEGEEGVPGGAAGRDGVRSGVATEPVVLGRKP
jgi:hypothetical protein